MSLSSTSLRKPKDWQDFERKTRELIACILNDPNTQMHGRTGQKQNGVDIYGYRRKDCHVGVQCKLKFEDEVTDKELRAEVTKAKKFKPAISEFILITTAPRDKKNQEAARLITEELKQSEHPIFIAVWGWEDVEEHASKHEQAWKAFDPTWNPFVERGFEKISLEIQELKQSMQGMRPPTSAPTDVSLNESDEFTPLHGQITAFQRLIDDGHVNAALSQLLKLKSDEWVRASRSERYRILVGIASAKLKSGEPDQAGILLIEAFNECPEHKNARKNHATGYLLINDHKKAAELAREILAENNSDANAAGILIHALINDSSCNNSLINVPEALYETKEVLIAHIDFMRFRDNPDWVNLAKTAAGKYPNDNLLKQFYAEAVLDELVRTDRDAIAGGILRNISTAEFDRAAEILYSEAREAIDKGYALFPSTAHNAALALRFSDDLIKAKEILDAGIKQFPKDEALRLQRAIIALSENDPTGALTVLPSKPTEPETIGVLAESLAATGKMDDALTLIDNTDVGNFPEHVKTDILALRTRAHIARGEKQVAIDIVAHRIAADPQNIALRALQIRTFRSLGDDASARKFFEEAIALVNDQTSLPSRLELSFEARKIGRDDAIIDILKDLVATDRASEGLHVLIAAAVNSGSWVTARKILSSVSPALRGSAWFQRVDAILAINTGDATADEKIARYLRQCPNDVQMILARIGILQRSGRDSDIQRLLKNLNLADLNGRPEHRIQIAALIMHYEDAFTGLKFGYSVLMNNWDNPKAHLAYQSLIFLNENIGAAMPLAAVVAENTVVCLLTEGNERRYRIEKEKHTFFEDERLNPESDLAILLNGKKPGDKFNLQDRIGSKPLEVRWIKPVYLDAFHCSLEQFNERFPRASGLLKFNFDPTGLDPFEDMRAIIKERAEADQRILAEYQSKSVPLSFAAALIGKDPLDAWSGLPSVNIQFQVCRGTFPEREDALKTIIQHVRKGCVMDAITLSMVHRLGVEKAITAVCGPIYTSQSVIDLMAARALEAKQNIGKRQGFMAWRGDRLVFEEFSEESMIQVADEREKEISWARSIAAIAPAMPKKDFSREVQATINTVGHVACDPAVSADGNDLLLLSEDMGFRLWAAATFEISTSWLQPVLIAARDQGHLATDEYCKTINMLVLSDHTYISLDSNCLMHQARKDNFAVTSELSRLICTVGGPTADLQANSGVLSAFIDMVVKECPDEIKVLRIASEAFHSITKGRQEDQRQLVLIVLKQIRTNKKLIYEHALGWLIGHSIGMSYFDELVQVYK